jgi:hypothetical protein
MGLLIPEPDDLLCFPVMKVWTYLCDPVNSEDFYLTLCSILRILFLLKLIFKPSYAKHGKAWKFSFAYFPYYCSLLIYVVQYKNGYF